jgi:hypothetical protein
LSKSVAQPLAAAMRIIEKFQCDDFDETPTVTKCSGVDPQSWCVLFDPETDKDRAQEAVNHWNESQIDPIKNRRYRIFLTSASPKGYKSAMPIELSPEEFETFKAIRDGSENIAPSMEVINRLAKLGLIQISANGQMGITELGDQLNTEKLLDKPKRKPPR